MFLLSFYQLIKLKYHVPYYTRSGIGISGNKHFHFKCQFTLYCNPQGVERVNSLRIGDDRTLHELINDAPFMGQDRRTVIKLEFLFGDTINSKESLIVIACPWLYDSGVIYALSDRTISPIPFSETMHRRANHGMEPDPTIRLFDHW